MALTRPKAAQVNFDSTNISDPLIKLNSGQSGSNTKDLGLVLDRGSDTNVAIIWDESENQFAVINTAEDGSTSGNVTIDSYANIKAAAFYGDGSNLTGVTSYSDSDVASYLSANGYDTATNIVASITDSAPGTLDTLNELAAALGDDPNFATTVTTSISTKWTQDDTKISNWDTAYSWGDHSTQGYITSIPSIDSIDVGDSSITVSDTGSDGNIEFKVDNIVIANFTDAGLMPNVDSNGTSGFDLGSSSLKWRDLYLSSGSLYIDGQKVVESDSGTIVVQADQDQSLTTKVTGTGVLTLSSAATINVDGTLQMATGKKITDVSGTAVVFGDKIDADNNQIINVGAPTDGSHAVTKTYVDNATTNLVDGAPVTLNTLDKIAQAINDDPAFSTAITTSIATKWTQDNTKISNWDAAFSWGDHSSAGYITDYTVTQADVTAHQAALSITESQISDLGSYLVAGDISGKADLASPTFTGTPAAPTAAAGTNTTQIATTAFVETAVSNLVDTAPEALNTLNELAAALGDDANFSTTISTQIGAKLDSSSYTAADVLTKIKTVDGASSGLDADLLDGQQGTYYLDYNNFSNKPTIPTNNNQLTNGAGYITSADGGNAATLDSLDSTQFLRSDADDTTSGQLTVNKASTYDTEGNLIVYGTGKNSIIVQTSDNASDRGMAFRNSGGAYIGYINMENRGSNTGDLVFGVNGSTASSVDDVAERMRITKEGNIVSAGGEFQGLATSSQYADLAENYLADAEYPIGTVLEIGGNAEVTIANPNSYKIVGTVSEAPGLLMNSGLEGDVVVPVAYIGRVPCRVQGTIKRGDFLVVGDTPGVAVAEHPMNILMGAAIGKALEDYDSSQEGVIEILVGRL